MSRYHRPPSASSQMYDTTAAFQSRCTCLMIVYKKFPSLFLVSLLILRRSNGSNGSRRVSFDVSLFRIFFSDYPFCIIQVKTIVKLLNFFFVLCDNKSEKESMRARTHLPSMLVVMVNNSQRLMNRNNYIPLAGFINSIHEMPKKTHSLYRIKNSFEVAFSDQFNVNSKISFSSIMSIFK